MKVRLRALMEYARLGPNQFTGFMDSPASKQDPRGAGFTFHAITLISLLATPRQVSD
jgi:hypothetical protein